MKTKKNEFFIDTYIDKYQNLSRNEKLSTNLSIGILLVLFSIGAIYNIGKAFGEFLFYFNN
ncbi:hypothetical protein [Flavobacterium sp. GSP6]|jgi:hypothetical protein|uniref:hypothetical protein n=1 Tax=Flavobacterium sp. GSP6 TaxID=2497488 RepID=UPI000F878C63|nr:hypothetical protein [Flavobacterium sp. GSP6]RTZ02110.1 hypothetical protein EKM03_14550 [Flavobacterium sp. GSP6]